MNTSPTRINKIKEETAKDEVLLSIRSVITQCWPNMPSTSSRILELPWRSNSHRKSNLKRYTHSHSKATGYSNYTMHTKVQRGANSALRDLCSGPTSIVTSKRWSNPVPLVNITKTWTWESPSCLMTFHKIHGRRLGVTYPLGTTRLICWYLTTIASSRWCENSATSGQIQQ